MRFSDATTRFGKENGITFLTLRGGKTRKVKIEVLL